MDPVTALGAISSAAQVASGAKNLAVTLYSFIKNTQHVTKTVRDLADTVNAFGSTCDLVRSSLETLAEAHRSAGHISGLLQANEDRLVWHGVQTRLGQCQHIIDELSSAISGVQKEQSTYVKQAWQQFKLNLSKERIESIQSRLNSHTGALSLSLQAIKIRVDYLIPRQADHRLLQSIAELRHMLSALSNSHAAGPVRDELTDYAERVSSDASTLYESSVASNSVVDHLETPPASPRLTQSGFDAVRAWSTNLATRPYSYRAPSSVTQSDAVSRASSSAIDILMMNADTGADGAGDPGDYDDFEVDVVKQTIEQGSAAFDNEKYAEAELFFSDAAQHLRQLPARCHIFCSLFDLQYKLAICAFYTQSPELAVQSLIAFLQQSAESSERKAKICHAGHVLAQAYVRLGSLELAFSSCENAVRGRRILFGRQHYEYFESLGLMARILELQGNKARSQAVVALVPSEHRQKIIQLFTDLKIWQPRSGQRNNIQGSKTTSKNSMPVQEPRKPSALPVLPGEDGRTPLQPSSTRTGTQVAKAPGHSPGQIQLPPPPPRMREGGETKWDDDVQVNAANGKGSRPASHNVRNPQRVGSARAAIGEIDPPVFVNVKMNNDGRTVTLRRMNEAEAVAERAARSLARANREARVASDTDDSSIEIST